MPLGASTPADCRDVPRVCPRCGLPPGDGGRWYSRDGPTHTVCVDWVSQGFPYVDAVEYARRFLARRDHAGMRKALTILLRCFHGWPNAAPGRVHWATPAAEWVRFVEQRERSRRQDEYRLRRGRR